LLWRVKGAASRADSGFDPVRFAMGSGTKERFHVSVPTTLQGTHDGCGGTVVFRPATHRSELLAGRTVVLSAACQACGETLSTEWRLPDAAIQAWEARQQTHAAHEQALPLAAGAEQWRSVAESHPQQQPTRDDLSGRPVADLGDWRLRAGARQAFTSPAAEPAIEAVQPEPAPVDEAMQAYLQRFSSKVEHARASLRQASTDLPSALESGDGGFRSPDFSRRPLRSESTLSATPAALHTPVEPAATIAAPVAEPVLEQPAPMPAPDDIAAAMASPTFHDDVAAAPAPIVEPAPAPIVEPAPAPIVEAVMPMAPPAPQAPALAEVAPAPPAVSIAPTDADVFPPAPVAAPAPAPPAPAALAAPPLPAPVAPVAPELPAVASGPDVAASVWHEMPVTQAAPPAPESRAPAFAPATPAAAAPEFFPQVPAPAPDSAIAEHAAPPAPSFAEAFGDAEATMPALGQPISPVAAGAPIAAAPAQPFAEDVSIVAPDDRGFDWGPDSDSPALPKKARRRPGLRRGAPKAEASVEAGPEVVFEPSPDADLVPAPRRSTVGPVVLVAVVLLAIVAGIAGMKVFTTDTASLQQSSTVTPEVPPADAAVPVDPAAAAGAGAAKPGAATKPGKQGAKAKPKAKAPAAAPPTTPGAAAPGTAVADPAPAETNPLADAAQAAGTSAPAVASQPQTAQVPEADADTPVVTAADADSDTNPFARPQ
jgi:hypothetical protein